MITLRLEDRRPIPEHKICSLKVTPQSEGAVIITPVNDDGTEHFDIWVTIEDLKQLVACLELIKAQQI